MATEAGWGNLDPNSAHQLWSHWTFTVLATHHIPLNEVKINAARWLKRVFRAVGRGRVTESVGGTSVANRYVIECEVEGPPANDPGFVAAIRLEFLKFVEMGWGPLASGDTRVRIIAGDRQDGRPPVQHIEIPRIGE